jgi:SNF2 family DNA or RNA helicase
MQIIDDKALLLRLRNPKQVTSVIPKSKELADNQVVVNWGIEEAQLLRSMDIKVPSPIERRYEWTGSFKPMSHQITTAAFLTMHKRAFCFNEQGTGKTASSIWAADYLMNLGLIRRVLVICPLSIMDSAWRGDLFTFAMHRTVGIAYGAAEKRKQIVNSGAEFIIINYDGLEIVADSIAKGGFDLVIVDEATHYKNAQTTRWKVLNKLLTPGVWLWMMTGTPAAQSPMDAYGIAKLINPLSVPRYVSTFKDMVMTKVSKFRWETRPDATHKVFEILRPAIRFTKEECLDLPDMTYVRRDVEMTRQQKIYYERLKNKLVMDLSGESVTAVNAAVAMSKLLQISSGAVYTDDGDTFEFDIKNRYNVLKEVIDESSQKVLIFVPFKHTIDILTDRLLKDGITTEVIRGDVPVHRRTDIFKRFQEQPTPRVLVIQPQSAAHGVTLTAANTVVWWSPTPSLETYAQANARVHRKGQKHPSTVVQLCGSPVEKRIYKLLDQRIDVHTKIVDLYKDLLD